MASIASVAALGGSRVSVFECSPSFVAVRPIRVVSRASCRINLAVVKRRAFVCRCMITTNLIEEKTNVFVPESTFRDDAAKNSSSSDDSEIGLKPSPKPLLKTRPSISTSNPGNSLQMPSANGVERSELVDGENVMESLGEVLEKAEKLEIADQGKLRRSTNAVGNSNSSPRPRSAPVDSSSNNTPAATKKSKTLKSVWRKGNPVADVQKVVKEIPKVASKDRSSTTSAAAVRRTESPPRAPYRPQSPQRTEPRLQSKPSVLPPPTPPTVKKPVERKQPILIDKFASKRQVVDPRIAQVVLGPRKPGKMHTHSKFRDDRRKKEGAPGSFKKRMVAEDGKILDEDASELNVSIPGTKKGRKWSKASRKAARRQAAKDAAPVKAEIIEVGEEGMLSEDLAYSLAVEEAEIFSFLFSKGVRSDMVQTLDKNMVKMICKEYEVEVIDAVERKVEDMAKKKQILDDEDLGMLEDRPPVITIMGHVDHGKTTLLDHIRKSKVVASEAGGITQGIGAYKVHVPLNGKPQPCVFLDTPGHEAFGAMRARGARVTDIAIIVVAADDGVRPQTNEAVSHAKAAGVPIVIAINKIDKDGATPDRVMQELSSIGVMPEDWGGEVPMIQISALKGENIDDLLETVMLTAELQELKANPHRDAKGTVIEAGLDKAKGPVATFIVQNGTLRKSDIVVCGEAFGKVRALFDDRGNRVEEARPSTAVQVIGLNNVPIAGDEFDVVKSLDIARERADACAEKLRAARISAKAGDGMVTLSSIASTVSAGRQSGLDMHQLNIILKVDVQGSIEAVRQAIQVLPQENVTLKFVHQASGDVNASDVDLAVATESVIFGFNVKTPGSIKSYADKKNVEVRLYRVIYELIDDLRGAMEGLLETVEEQLPIGTVEVRAVFSSGSGRVAGCMVTEGKVVKDCGIRVFRNGKAIHTGRLDSLRRVKEEVKEVNAGMECGIGINDYTDWATGDVIEAFNSVKKKRTLEEASASVAAALAGAGVGQ